MVEQIEATDLRNSEWLTLSKYAHLGAAIAAEIMIGFWFGIGIILAVGVVDG